ncbi:hypothetical protein Dimus_039307 [Dionaea muscipula]
MTMLGIIHMPPPCFSHWTRMKLSDPPPASLAYFTRFSATRERDLEQKEKKGKETEEENREETEKGRGEKERIVCVFEFCEYSSSLGNFCSLHFIAEGNFIDLMTESEPEEEARSGPS